MDREFNLDLDVAQQNLQEYMKTLDGGIVAVPKDVKFTLPAYIMDINKNKRCTIKLFVRKANYPNQQMPISIKEFTNSVCSFALERTLDEKSFNFNNATLKSMKTFAIQQHDPSSKRMKFEEIVEIIYECDCLILVDPSSEENAYLMDVTDSGNFWEGRYWTASPKAVISEQVVAALAKEMGMEEKNVKKKDLRVITMISYRRRVFPVEGKYVFTSDNNYSFPVGSLLYEHDVRYRATGSTQKSERSSKRIKTQ